MKKILSVLLAFVLFLSLASNVLAAEHAVNGLPAVTLDGVITEEEWGKPIFSGVDKAKATDGSVDSLMTYWDFDPSYAGGESIDLYVNNDSVNLYFGLVVHDTTPDASSDGANLWQHQNFTFTFSYSAPDTTVPHIEFEGYQYEQYTGYRIGMLADGSLKSECLSLGVDPVELTAGRDYAVVYDEAAKTMTYEVAIPYEGTNMNLESTNYMAFSMLAALNIDSNPVSGATDGASRFLLGTGAAFGGGPNNFAHQGQAAVIVLNDASAVAGVTPPAAEEPEPEEPEAAAPAEQPAETEPAVQETVVVEKVEKEIVWKPGVCMIVIIASGAVVLASAAVIAWSCIRRRPKRQAEPETADEPEQPAAAEESEAGGQ